MRLPGSAAWRRPSACLAGDDATLCCLPFGFEHFDEMKRYFEPRLTALRQEHLNGLRQHPRDADALRESWKRYQPGYDRTEEVQYEKDWSLSAADPAADGGERQCPLVHRPAWNEALFSEGISFPVYPAENANPVLREKQLARCRRFEEKKRRLYSAMSCVIGDTPWCPVTDFFRFGLHYYAVSEEIPQSPG